MKYIIALLFCVSAGFAKSDCSKYKTDYYKLKCEIENAQAGYSAGFSYPNQGDTIISDAWCDPSSGVPCRSYAPLKIRMSGSEAWGEWKYKETPFDSCRLDTTRTELFVDADSIAVNGEMIRVGGGDAVVFHSKIKWMCK